MKGIQIQGGLSPSSGAKDKRKGTIAVEPGTENLALIRDIFTEQTFKFTICCVGYCCGGRRTVDQHGVCTTLLSGRGSRLRTECHARRMKEVVRA